MALNGAGGNTTAVAAIMRSIKEARNYALNSQYETAITFYEGLDQEIAHHINHSIPAEKHALKGQWEEFRVQLANERALCVDVQAELKSLVDPVLAVRRDRMQVGGGGGTAGEAGNSPSAPAYPPQSRGGRPDYNEVPYRPEHRDPPPPQPQQHNHGGGGGGGVAGSAGQWAASGMPDYANLGGGGGVGMDFGLPAGKKPVNTLSARNEAQYGDADRFGPPKQQQQTPQRGAGGGGGWSNAYNNQTPNRGGGGGASPAHNSNPSGGRQKTKPPLPKFGAQNNNAGAGGGGGGGRAPSKGAGNRAGGGGGGRQGGGGQQQHQKYVPRAGDEELAAQIESDMFQGSTSGVSWNDVAGHEEAKALLEEAVVYPVIMPDYYQGIRRPWKGVLMYGPPGTGKTMLAKAVASECGTTFFNMTSATLTSKYRGDSEKLVRILFEMARHYAPSCIFIDEIDSLCGQRGGDGEHEASRRAKSVLLTQMDGVGVDQSKIVMVLGATNHPWDIDEAMRRRLEQRIYIPLPSVQDCMELMEINTRKIKLADDVDFEELARVAAKNNYSAADISNVVRDAGFAPMRRFLKQRDRRDVKTHANEIQAKMADEPVHQQDFLESIRKMPSSVNVKQIQEFEKWQREFATNQ